MGGELIVTTFAQGMPHPFNAASQRFAGRGGKDGRGRCAIMLPVLEPLRTVIFAQVVDSGTKSEGSVPSTS